MIKLSELIVKPQGITPEKAHQYYINNININNNIFDVNNPGWIEYKELCTPYCEKYGIFWFLSSFYEFEKLSQQDLNQFYKEMRALVRKHVGKEILSELQITPQNITPEKVNQYFNDNIWNNHKEFGNYSDGWEKYIDLCKPYCKKYDITNFLGMYIEFEKLPQSELNKFYKEMRTLVRKYVDKEILSELQVKPQGITPEKVQKYYINNLYNNDKEFGRNSPGWGEYIKLCEPYCIKYEILWIVSTLYEFKQLTQSDLNQLYQDMRTLVRKHVGKEIL